jgi:hypothetical protein
VSRLSVDQWRRLVYGSNAITDKVKVYLLYLADYMALDRKVTLSRDRVAEALGVSTRRIDDRNTAAIRAGFLTRVVRGQKGVTAVYQATRPDPFSATKSSALMRDGSQRPETPFSATPGGRTYVRETGTDLAVGQHRRYVSTDEEHRDTPAAYGLTVCDCHGYTDCVSLNRADIREETA